VAFVIPDLRREAGGLAYFTSGNSVPALMFERIFTFFFMETSSDLVGTK